MAAIAPPKIIYGTAWKQDATAGLLRQAVAAGYRGIDCANQKKHYREDYAGQALLELRAGGVSREEVFLQSKYTSQDGQDHRLPYDPAAPLDAQVRASFAGSLRNFHTDYLDSYLMHGPSAAHGMADEDWEVWTAMEGLHQAGQARSIGVSNVRLQHLLDLQGAKVKPMVVQNRCYAVRGWDRDVREHCLAHGIVYQGFSLLTANPQIVGDRRVEAMARRLKATPAQVVFRFAAKIGILPLTGTADPRHMKDDLEALTLEFSDADAGEIAALSR